MKKRKPMRCEDQKPCKGLAMHLDRDGGGLIARYLVNLKSGYQRDLYIVRKNARDVGVVLNFCPFCGTEINKNERYPHLYKKNVEKKRAAPRSESERAT